MRLGSITEFGATPPRYGQVLDDLHRSGRKRHGDFPCKQYFLAAFGSTDLVEIATFHHYFHLTQVGGSGAQAFRRSVGVVCPDDDELDEIAGSGERAGPVCTVEEALKVTPWLPFAAVLYAKLGTSASLALAECELDRPLPWLLLGSVADELSPIWTWYREILDATLDGGSELPLRVAPLLGLDAVEQVLVVRAERLEQIAALSMALRHQRLETIRPASQAARGLRTMADLMGRQRGEPAWWDASPLFDGTSSVVGIPLRHTDSRRGRGWQLETTFSAFDADDPVAAQTGMLLARNRYAPGGFQQVLSRARLHEESEADSSVDDGEPGPSAEPTGHTGSAASAGAGDGEPGAPNEDEATTCIILFDRRDLLWNIRHPTRDSAPMPLRPVTLGELADRVRLLSGLPPTATVPADRVAHPDEAAGGRAIATDLSVAVRVPPSVAAALPECDFSERFADRLTDCRREHTRPDLLTGWRRRWLRATKAAGMTYPFTNGGVVLIDSVLGMLSTDFAEFVDLLPALEALVRLAEELAKVGLGAASDSAAAWRSPRESTSAPTPRELIRMYELVEALASSRVRRTHPLKRPGAGLAVHGHAGHQLPRDAFVAFVESLAKHLGHAGGAILVLDSPGGGLSCEIGPGGALAVRISTMALHHPLNWASAHELAHALFEQAPPPSQGSDSLDPGRQHLADAAARLRQTSRVGLEPDDSLGVHLRAVASDLRHIGAASTKKDVARALASLVEEVSADLLLHDSLALPEDTPEQTAARFWFLHGPCLLFDLQNTFASTPLSDVVLEMLLLRIWLVGGLLDGGLEPDAWAAGLADLVEAGRDVAEGPGADGSSSNQALKERLAAVREDLGVPSVLWLMALDRIEGLAIAAGQGDELSAEIIRLVQIWLDLAVAVRAALAPKHDDARDADPWLAFIRYIEILMTETVFEVAIGDGADVVERRWRVASPWPPFVRGHDRSRAGLVTDSRRWAEEGVVISRRGGVMAGDQGQQHYNLITTAFVLELDEAVRRARLDKLLDYFGSSARVG